MMKKLFALLAGLTVVTALLGLTYYFFKLNPEYCPFHFGTDDEELD
jgi:hypothetical protein